uniref:Chloride channel protein n=1 Tax=Prasinoderma singulare TaxID=676789 RepID=A0A7S3FDR9_9VIRI|mmetsp:Transcript_22172/g.68570  ORF Transcript_22172/g.68570 Transcript_22172/m.68570 type:complete len:845 (+) Transcript_22172:16-2550(+)
MEGAWLLGGGGGATEGATSAPSGGVDVELGRRGGGNAARRRGAAAGGVGKSQGGSLRREEDDGLGDLGGFGGEEELRGADSGLAADRALREGGGASGQDALRQYPWSERAQAIESLDYEVIDNARYRAEQAARSAADVGRDSLVRWTLSVLIGVLTGCAAFVVNLAVENITGLKFAWVLSLMRTNMLLAFALYCTVNVGLVLSSTVIVTYYAPAAAGSGIPDVKAYLNGVDYPGVLLFRTLIGKMAGSIGSVAGGLAVGKEGPLVHTGSCIAAALAQGGSAHHKLHHRLLQNFRNDRERREFVTCGAAAGVAAAFHAPVGGVLFALEEATSHWRSQLTWRAFFTCAVVVVTLKALTGFCSGGRCGYLGSGGFMLFEISQGQEDYETFELVPMAMLGVTGGLLGALFNQINLRVSRWRKLNVLSRREKVIEACLVALVTSVCSFCVPLFFACQACPDDSELVCPREELHYGNFLAFNCPLKDQYNDLATIFFNTHDDAIRNLFSSNTMREYHSSALIVYLGVFFTLAVVTYGISVPSGLFVPSILCGAAYGRLVGMVMVHYHGHTGVDEGTYALLGAASFLGGAMRMTVSLCVILMELTSNLKIMPLVMLVLLIGKAVGDWFNGAIYDIHVDLKEIPFLGEKSERFMRSLSAIDAVGTRPVGFRRIESVRNVVRALRETPHSAFPVMGPDGLGSPCLLGSVLRSYLLVMLRHKADFFSPEERDLRPGRLPGGAGRRERQGGRPQHDFKYDVSEFSKSVSTRGLTIEDIKVTEQELDMVIDLLPLCNASPHVVSSDASLTKVYSMFRQMGLRHLFVVPRAERVLGIITRKDLLVDSLESRCAAQAE